MLGMSWFILWLINSIQGGELAEPFNPFAASESNNTVTVHRGRK